MKRLFILALAALLTTGAAAAFAPVPKQALKALQATRGKPFDSGLVFIDGKYVEPPYVVGRYGTAIRINGIQVTGPLVSWEDFIRTQEGVTVTGGASGGTVPVSTPALTAPKTTDEANSLDELFEDEKADEKADAKNALVRTRPQTVTYSLAGPFKHNAKSRELLAKMNAARTSIDLALRRGGFFFFGSAYSRVSGDVGTASQILKTLPKLQREYADYADFAAAVRGAGFVFFPEALVKDLHANRVDYLRLQQRESTLSEE